MQPSRGCVRNNTSCRCQPGSSPELLLDCLLILLLLFSAGTQLQRRPQQVDQGAQHRATQAVNASLATNQSSCMPCYSCCCCGCCCCSLDHLPCFCSTDRSKSTLAPVKFSTLRGPL